MSATIPENMLLSDLLKSTGYDCPDSLKDKTFDESTSGGSEVVLENNKEVTITENGTVEITPSEGKDGMKKVTANVNVAGGADIEANKLATIDVSTYTEPVEITPTAGKDGMAKATVTLSNIPSGGSVTLYAWNNEDDVVYTLSATPSVGQYALYGQSGVNSFNQCALIEITNVTTPNYITVASGESSMQMYRNDSRDINF